jgi:putative phage-type endonuclease
MSKYFFCAQRSDEWYALRLGVATASDFGKIITPTGQPTKSERSKDYMYKLISQLILGSDDEAMVVPTGPMMRGKIMENDAADYYHLVTGNSTKEVGFILSDNKMYGASPDRLVDDDGLVEIKVPNAGTHIGYLINDSIDPIYKPQVQGQLLLSGRQWCDWVSYHDFIRPIIIRTYRDDEYIQKLQDAIDEFCLEYLNAIRKLIDRGIVEEHVLSKFV